MAPGNGSGNDPKSPSTMPASSSTSNKPKSPLSKSGHQKQAVAAMIRQGFIPDSVLSSSRLHALPPPPTFHGPNSPNSPTSSSATLSEMLGGEQMARDSRPPSEAQKKLQERVSDILFEAPFQLSDEWGPSDVRLTVVAKAEGGLDGFRASMDVHSRVLAAKSQFFAEKLRRSGMHHHSVEILDCDDVEMYVEAVVLMYYDELRSRLRGMNVPKVLSLLKIFCAIVFDDGVRACLDYLEVMPWTESEEDLVVTHVKKLQLGGSRTDALLERVRAEPSTSSRGDEIFLKLSNGVLQAKDDKARKAMKALITRLIEEDSDDDGFDDGLNISKDTLYSLCDRCLRTLTLSLSGATSYDESKQDRGELMCEIARAADNMLWIVKILIGRKVGEEFVKIWADQKALSVLHSQVPTMYRHEISKITAHLCVSIGRGQILVPKETRYALLSTWLEALYGDFKWLRMGGKSFDWRLVEEGLGQTILTLPLAQQQSILLNWFDIFLDRGDDCPNIQGAFEIWWRRTFMNEYDTTSQMQITVCGIPQ